MSLGCVQNGVYCSAVHIGRGFKSSLSERGRYNGSMGSKMRQLGVQNGVYCSAVRIGRGFKSSLSERGRYNGSMGVQNEGRMCPKCVYSMPVLPKLAAAGVFWQKRHATVSCTRLSKMCIMLPQLRDCRLTKILTNV